MIERIVRLKRERWQDYVLSFNYTSNNYYDVKINQDTGGFNVSFAKKPLDTPFVANTRDKLFQPWYNDIRAWGIVEDEKLIAVIETSVEEWNNRLRVTELWIDSAYHRMGIGTALMDIAVKRAKNENRRAVVLETQTCNENAISFYLAYGFSLIGFDTCCYGNSDIEKKEVRVEFGLLLEEKKSAEKPELIFRIANKNDARVIAIHEKHISEKILHEKILLGEIFAAYEKENLKENFIGWLRFSYFWDTVPLMNMLQILPDYRSKGIGRRLVEFWESEMKKQDHKVVMTSTQQNEQAQHFYNKLGYAATGGFVQMLEKVTEESYEIIFMKKLECNK